MPIVLLVVVLLLVTLIAAGPAIEHLIDRRWPPSEDGPDRSDDLPAGTRDR